MDIDTNLQSVFGLIDTSNTSSNTVSSNTNMSSALPSNISMVPSPIPPGTKVPDAALDIDLFNDYNLVRRNYEQVVNKGLDAIDEIMEIAKNSQHPRAYEVAGALIKNVAETNEKLITLQKQMRDMTRTEKTGSSTNIDKAIFIGSASDLNKMLKSKKDEE